MIRYCLFLAVATLVFSCAESEDDDSTSVGFSSGIPTLASAVEASTPSGLSGVSTSSLSPQGSCTLNSSSTAANILSCFQDYIFVTLSDPSQNGNLQDVSLMKHVYEVDNRVGNFETRFEAAPECLSATGTEFSMTLDLGSSKTTTITTYLSCYETHSVPDGESASQDMAFGQDSEGNWHLVLRTSYNSLQSGRILSAKTNSSGNTVDLWQLSYYDYDGDASLNTPGAGDSGSDDVGVLRLLVDRSTNAFTYGLARYNYNNNDFVEVMMRSNGTDLNVADVSVSNGSSSISNNPFTNSGCVSASDTTTAGSDCSSLTGVPTDFGYSSALQESDMNNTSLSSIKAFFSNDTFAINGLTSVN